MTNQELLFFQELTKDRQESADMLEKPSMRGIKKSVIEKYSDQAHFIYELLQNADDAGATRAKFVLEKERLLFAHNGTRYFTVTDPANEEQDSQDGKLGDINAITSIANSNKTEASIGKFGIGFKAVFQYTSTPYIYDPNVRFRIDRFIVPIMISEDDLVRKEEETLFVFPFDSKERNCEEAYSDIADKLRSLTYPTLFLSNLTNISYEFGGVSGKYSKEIKEELLFDNTTAQCLWLTQEMKEQGSNIRFWLFSRTDDMGGKYSVGFCFDEKDHLCPVKEPAFCFFPTREDTGLNFIIHAPFLLTDSREGIRAGVDHNNKMVELLSILAADALVYLRDIGLQRSKRLIDDDILKIIPVNEGDFSNFGDKRKISFMPFYCIIQKKFKNEKLLPTSEDYVTMENAYWADDLQLTEIFSNEQLADLCQNKNARWVFISLEQNKVDWKLKSYLNQITKCCLSETTLINGINVQMSLFTRTGINASFIEKQPMEWLHGFYKWLSESSRRTEIIKKKPVFLDQDKKAASAYDNSGQLILFLPAEDVEGYRIVYPELLENIDTKKFLEKVGVKKPDIKDYIYNFILPKYKTADGIDTTPHFKLFFEYYRKCPQDEVENFIELIKKCKFIKYCSAESPKIYRGSAQDMYLYYPTEELVDYFETKPDTNFVVLDDYKKLAGKAGAKYLDSFLVELGVKKDVGLLEDIHISYEEATNRRLPMRRSTRYQEWKENLIDGCKEIVEYIAENHSIEKSVLLWKQLIELIRGLRSWSQKGLSGILKGRYRFFYRKAMDIEFNSADVNRLRGVKWLVDKEGNFLSPKNIYVGNLLDKYDVQSDEAKELLSFLDIKEEESRWGETEKNLSDEQKTAIAFAKRCIEAGISENDLEDFKRWKEAQIYAGQSHQRIDSGNELREKHSKYKNENADLDELSNLLDEDWQEDSRVPGASNLEKNTSLNRVTARVTRDILNKTREISGYTTSLAPFADDEDSDEYMPKAVDYSKEIERAKRQSANEIARIAREEELNEQALNLKKYSYGWFKTLLELEVLNGSNNNLNSKEISISFARVEKEAGTKRTLILKHPNRYIPQFMEELADIPLVLYTDEHSKTVAIEVASVKSYTLRVKLKSKVDWEDIDLSEVREARIETKSPIFLLEELKSRFEELKYDDDFDIQKNLCENIEFIFGPPGTGKTTYLAAKVLLPFMREKDDLKVLVLTPTNKAADVLVSRLMEIMEQDTSYTDWLVRFGTTNDEKIEQSPIYREKNYNILNMERTVVVTTIARFSYDCFMPQGTRMFLDGMKWDYIVIDEASMIPLANIVYPLYKKTPKKFIIAGDPFQIEPIMSSVLWKDENIYKMVQLNSFVNPQTVPHKYKVELLTTQYRSIPTIGEVFSRFAYGGILKHYRDETSQRNLHIDDKIWVNTLNLIKFPVSKYESIYRSKRLRGSSPYQIYSALFAFEFVNFLAGQIAHANGQEEFRIGIIAPYRAQADLIDKLLGTVRISKNVDVQVGTIHGFQGDECDVIIVVFNTPPSISDSRQMFLNKQNIINVSISRAKDYLFVILPDDNTENIENLKLVKRVERYFKESERCSQFASHDIEELIFNNAYYLEDNTFSTSHQNVNVYGLPERCYEIRSEDMTIDVQIHKDSLSPTDVS